jgi:hypothetical protein
MEGTTDPQAYPARCDTDRDGLEELKARFEDENDDFGETVDGEWPPTDSKGNVFPIFFAPDEVDDNGRLFDRNNTPYNPFTGNIEPIEREKYGACNAPVDKWRLRYPEVRFCGKIANTYNDLQNGNDHTYCSLHRNRKHMSVPTAEEQIQTGMFVNSVDHLYEQLDPWKKLVGWGTFESLMGQSTYEFAPEYEQRTLDFSDQPFQPDGCDEDGQLDVKFGYPTSHPQSALYLYVAAMQTVQMISVQPRIMAETVREDGTEEGMMEVKSVDKAQLTAPPSEHDSSPQEFKTIETWNEHHLNLPMSRLISDQPDLLEMGGVEIDPESEADGPSSEDIVLEIDADPDGVETKDETGTDPNAFENYESESAKITRKASDAENDDNA